MSNELGNTPADKNYKPNGIISEEYPEKVKVAYLQGYEQAEKDINREMLDRMNEIREKQTKAALEDLNYTIKIDPALGFDEGSAVVYHGKEIISVLTWEDMRKIIRIDEEMMDDPEAHPEWMEEQPFYEEMLRRFKEAKK